MEPQVMSY